MSASCRWSVNSASRKSAEDNVLTRFFHWLADTILALGYPGIIALMAIESSVLPLPSELVMPPAGYLAAKGQMNGLLAVIAGTFGSVLGALINYELALHVGEPLLRKYGKYVLISSRSLDKTERFFRRHGEISTLIGRLLPVVRHLISIPAGVSRMPLQKFVAFTALGAGIWCAILTYLGWLIGKHGQQVETVIGSYVHHTLLSYILPAVVVLLAGYLIWHRRGADEVQK
jgi:membrane protein DedA with SNARE-associated domain